MVKQHLMIACLVIAGNLQAQGDFADSSFLPQAIFHARYRYDSLRAGESAIYNGIQVTHYPREIEGTAFFESVDFQKATIVYGDVVYKDISLNYDLVKHQVIVSPEGKPWLMISIFSPRVKEFYFASYKFVYLRQPDHASSLSNGFYKVMTEGKITAFASHRKTIFSKVMDNSIYRRFDEKIIYYLLKDGTYYRVENARDLFNMVKKHKREVQQILSQHKLKFRKNPEKTIKAAVESYNRLEQ